MAKKLLVAPSIRNNTTLNVPLSTLSNDNEGGRTYSSRNLAKFSKLDIDWDVNAIKNSLTSTLTTDSDLYSTSQMSDYSDYSNFTSNNEYIAFFDKSYE